MDTRHPNSKFVTSIHFCNLVIWVPRFLFGYLIDIECSKNLGCHTLLYLALEALYSWIRVSRTTSMYLKEKNNSRLGSNSYGKYPSLRNHLKQCGMGRQIPPHTWSYQAQPIVLVAMVWLIGNGIALNVTKTNREAFNFFSLLPFHESFLVYKLGNFSFS